MRYHVYGSPPDSGGWADFFAEFNTRDEALLYAFHQLERGCTVSLSDEETGLITDLQLGYDGLGKS